MNWILQDKSFGFGNFINITPIIKKLHEDSGRPVPVYFEMPFVKEAYLNDPRIELLEEKPSTPPIVDSKLICKANTTPDFVFAFEKVFGEPYTDKYKPSAYTTMPPMKGDYVVILMGSGSDREDYVKGKTPSKSVYEQMIFELQVRGIELIFTGSEADAKRAGKIASYCRQNVGDIRESLSLIANARAVIGNDTGLVHAAGAMDKEMFVIWKDTPFIRCQNSGKNTTYSKKGNWMNDFYNWIEKI